MVDQCAIIRIQKSIGWSIGWNMSSIGWRVTYPLKGMSSDYFSPPGPHWTITAFNISIAVLAVTLEEYDWYNYLLAVYFLKLAIGIPCTPSVFPVTVWSMHTILYVVATIVVATSQTAYKHSYILSCAC